MVSFQASLTGAARPRTFFERFGHIGIAVLPTTVLSDDPLLDPDTGARLPSLREQISLVDGISHPLLCYARTFTSCGDGLYWAEVASTLDFANTARIVLTEEDLYAALPWDIRLQGKCPGDILVAMQAHTRAVRPASRVKSEGCREQGQQPSPLAAMQQLQSAREEPLLIPLPELFVSVEQVEAATHEPSGTSPETLPSHPATWARLVWLRAALAMVRQQVRQSRHLFAKLDILLDTVLDAQRYMRQSLVSASEVSTGDRLLGWRLQIAFPMMEALA